MSSNGNGSGKPFWTTLPGILTGIAALITAVGGVYVALNRPGSNGGNGGETPTPTRVAGPIEYGYYRYRAADLYAYVFDQDDPNKCREMCLNDPNCKAWTTNTPPCNADGKARCWLHSTAGTREPATSPIPYCTNACGVINE
jgi:hypothetical protein